MHPMVVLGIGKNPGPCPLQLAQWTEKASGLPLLGPHPLRDAGDKGVHGVGAFEKESPRPRAVRSRFMSQPSHSPAAAHAAPP